ncbi:probable endonuclease 4 [Firmicutes bacterium CAG:884]|nr:probable endonuclease 4 [Firmicutes bacterium CAG:884]
MELIIGSHVSFTKETQLVGSLNEALSYKANTFMFYTGAPQNTNRCKIDEELTKFAHKKMQENNIDINNIVIHAPYIINLANEANMIFNIKFLQDEIDRATSLNVNKIVLHPGSHIGKGNTNGINNIITSLNQVNFKNVKILLETMAGKGTECGISINELKTIIDGIKDKEHIGVCLDTCHLNDSGIDISKFDEYLEEFDKEIGINKIGCIHINDSKNPINSHKDRHENIGFGTIGFDNLIKVIYNEKLENIPKILETPYIEKKPPYKEEIAMIRKKEFNNNLINEITNNSRSAS